MNQENLPTPSSPSGARPITAVLLSFLAPGLGLIYVGRLLAGLVIHALFLLLSLLFVITAALFQFFPLFPGLVLVATWFVFCLLSAWRSLEIIEHGEAQRSAAYHHPLIYILIALMTYLGPMAMTAHFASSHLFAVIPVEHEAMVPQAHPGDRLLVDRTVYRNDAPRRGDLVAVRNPETSELSILRVVAVPTDQVEVNGYSLVINEELADYSPFDPQINLSNNVDELADSDLWIEHIYDQRHVISIGPGPSVISEESGYTLGEDQYFVISDNRAEVPEKDDGTKPVDSRFFGPVSGAHIEGQPVYITWSTSPESGSTRWDRIGLQTQ